MIIEYPSYYEQFRCIGGVCPDTCCAGWEVDIDDETAEVYREADGEIGCRLRAAMRDEGEGVYLPLTEDGRCPFLNRENLCDIYTALGEESLSRVCTEYPRYYIEVEDYEQIDMSLSCMELGRIFFGTPGPLRYVRQEIGPEDVEDNVKLKALLERRNQRIAELQTDDGITLRAKLSSMAGEIPGWEPESDEEILAVMGELELLDPSWEEVLSGTAAAAAAGTDRRFLEACGGQIAPWFTKLACYFLFRYSIDAYEDHDDEMEFRLLSRSLRFLLLMCAARWERNGHVFTVEDMIDLAHIYSRQVEHSEENVERVKQK